MADRISAVPQSVRTNRSKIYHFIRNSPEGSSRQDIVRALNLSLPTVINNLEALLAEGLIAQRGSVGNTGGRRAWLYSAVNDVRIALGLDITRHHISVVAVDQRGQIIGRLRIRHEFSRTDDYYRKLGFLVDELINSVSLDRSRILGVGIGVPGLITSDNQTVFYGKILDFTGATCADFSKYIDFPTAFYNDANAAGFAEIWDEHEQNAFYIMLSNNVGGSILLNNSVYYGENLRGGEVGHFTLKYNGKPCYCGQCGCVDAYCAATVLSELTNGNLQEFFELLKSGDSNIRAAWQEYLENLAVTVNNLRMLFDCNVIIGGYVGAYMDDYLNQLKELAKKLNTFESNADYIRTCRYKNESIAAGAALPFINSFLLSI